MAACENLELACLRPEDHRARHPCFVARGGGSLPRFPQKSVVRKTILDGDGQRGPARGDFAIVDAAGELVEAQTAATEAVLERG